MDDSRFSQRHEDIKLTKEEAEFLENQFYKYLRKEMENNSSNWTEFYDILKEETQQTTHSSSDTKNTSGSRSSENHHHPPPPKGGFKVNPEKTKQEYKKFPGNSKWQKNFNSDNHKHHSKPPKNNSNGQVPTQNPSYGNTNRQADTEPKKPSRKTRKADKKDNRTEQMENEKMLEMPKSLPSRIFKISKEVVVIFICFALMILLYGLSLAWKLVRVIFKLTVILLLFVFAKLLQLWVQLNERFRITKNLINYLHNALELIHLVLGVNVKRFFTSKKNGSNTNDGIIQDGPPPPLPETSEEAIKFLLKENSEKPYRVLCVDRSATSDEIKTNYRKLVRLVHPDKCNEEKSEDAFKILDTAFKKLSNPEARQELDNEMQRQHAWEEYSKAMGDEYKNMFEHLLTTIRCNKCDQRHKKELVKDRTFYTARYCDKCNAHHAARDGDIWAEVGFLGMKWKCYACLDAEVFDVTEWAVCQEFKGMMPVNDHRVYFRFGTGNGHERRKKRSQEEKFETGGKQRKGKKNKRRK